MLLKVPRSLDHVTTGSLSPLYTTERDEVETKNVCGWVGGGVGSLILLVVGISLTSNSEF